MLAADGWPAEGDVPRLAEETWEQIPDDFALPFIKLFAESWLSSAAIARMSPIAECGFFRLLLWQWQSVGSDRRPIGLPIDDRQLARMARLSERQWADERRMILPQFVRSSGALWNVRLESERVSAYELRANKGKGGRAAAQQRAQQTPQQNVSRHPSRRPAGPPAGPPADRQQTSESR